MDQKIRQWLVRSLEMLREQHLIVDFPTPEVKPPKDRAHGDYVSNVALIAAQGSRQSARRIAEAIVAALEPLPDVDRIEVAGPGFINFHLKASVRADVVARILDQQESFGRCRPGKGRALVEFVSANPTGPLHIGHGRGAAYGAALVNLLTAAGYETDGEYYINDRGRQMDVLALSVWLRYLELCAEQTAFPRRCYQGDYVWDVAAQLRNKHGEDFKPASVVMPADAAADEEQHLDQMIEQMKALLEGRFQVLFDAVCEMMLDSIATELKHFGVIYTRWFSERDSLSDEEIERAIAVLDDAGFICDKDGARWFRSTALGDEKDRVVVRSNGQATYFASDVAYHFNKYRRGYDLLVNVWGADHHGYVPRIIAALKAAKFDDKKLRVMLVQFVNLYRDGKIIPMSTRSGEFQPLAALRKEVGRDAARLFYLTCRHSQHMDFDVALACSRSADNPVYYIQYAHARVCSVFARARDKGVEFIFDPASLALLDDVQEIELLKLLPQYPGVLRSAAAEMEPYLLLDYLRKLAGVFHSYYNNCRFLAAEYGLRNARLALVKAVGRIIRNGLEILGVSAPRQM